MTDQAYSLRKKAWEKARKATYLSVSSGKGGVGKTNFVVNLAYRLTKLGKKVLVFDADLGLANVDIILNISANKTIKDYLGGKSTLEQLIKKDIYGFDVIPAASGFVELSSLGEKEFERIVDIFVELDNEYDYIIFDTGAGISENVIRYAAFADKVIVITQPEPTAITDAYAFMKVVNIEYDIKSIYFVINRVEDVGAVKSIHESMNNVVKKFLNINLELLGFMREDKQVIKSVRSQKPVCETSPSSHYARDINNIARKLVGIAGTFEPKPNIYRLLKGVFK